MQSTGPQTPPQQDLNKMQQPQQQMYAPPGGSNTSGNIRPNQQGGTNMYNRATNQQQGGGPRVPRHSIQMQQQSLYQQPISLVPFPAYNQRQPTYATPYPYPPAIPQNYTGFHYFQHIMTTPPATAHNRVAVANAVQVGPNGALVGQTIGPSGVLQGPTQPPPTQQNKSRPNAIPIIHPETLQNIMEHFDLPLNKNMDQQQIGQDQTLSQLDDSSIYEIGIPRGAIPNEMPPIVSAMTDAPSFEIHPKQPPKRKNKSIPIINPDEAVKATPAATADDKLQPGNVSNSNNIAKTAEDIPNTSSTPLPVTEDIQQIEQLQTAVSNTTPTAENKPLTTTTTFTEIHAEAIAGPIVSSDPDSLSLSGSSTITQTTTVSSSSTSSSSSPLPTTKSGESQAVVEDNTIPSSNVFKPKTKEPQNHPASTESEVYAPAIVESTTPSPTTSSIEVRVAGIPAQVSEPTVETVEKQTSKATDDQKMKLNEKESDDNETTVIKKQQQPQQQQPQQPQQQPLTESISTTTSSDSNENVVIEPVVIPSKEDGSTLSTDEIDLCAVTPKNATVIASDMINNNTKEDTTTTSEDSSLTNGSKKPSTDDKSSTDDAAASVSSTAFKALITYNEGQWSPDNPEGMKQYDKQQLILLREARASTIKPVLKNKKVQLLILASNQRRAPQSSLMPQFMLNNKRGQSTGGSSIGSNAGANAGGFLGGSQSISGASGQYMKQSSMTGNNSGNVNPRNNSKGSKSLIHVNLSIGEDIKLNESDNAWRPNHLRPEVAVVEATPDERESLDLKRRVRGILNRLTPEKFEVLVSEIMKLQIDTSARLNDVMILVFEKAIDEPNFSVSYAMLCRRLATEIKVEDEKEKSSVHFRSVLIDKTENEFNCNVTNCQAKENKLQPILAKLKECTDPMEKAELSATLEEEERKIRRRSVGTVKFIGELYKIGMLTHKITSLCIGSLLDDKSEDKLECLCKLMTTVGKKYDEIAPQTTQSKIPSKEFRPLTMDKTIAQMQAIVDRKTSSSSKISSRVRFMLQDVIDLRRNKWVPSQTKIEGPKTMDQIQKEAKIEQLSSTYGNYAASSTGSTSSSMQGVSSGMGNKKDVSNDRVGRYTGSSQSQGGNQSSYGNLQNSGNSGGNSNNYRGNRGGNQQSNSNQNSDEWHVQTSKGNRIDANKLENMMINTEVLPKLGASSQFIMWNSGSNSHRSATPVSSSTQPYTTSNSFAALSALDSSKQTANGKGGKGQYNKGSMERDRYGDRGGSGSGMNSRCGSAHGSRESSSSRGGNRMNSAYISKSASHQNTSTLSRPSSKTSLANSESSSAKSSPTHKDQTQQQQPPPQQYQYPSAPPPAEFAELDEYEKERVTKIMSFLVKKGVATLKFDESMQALLSIPENLRWSFIFIIFYEYLHYAKLTQSWRVTVAELIIFLLKKNFISLEHFMHGYNYFASIASDLLIDVPNAWQYIFQCAIVLITKNLITVKDLWSDELKEQRDMGKKFLKEYLNASVQRIGQELTRSTWNMLDLKWSDFMDEADVENFIKSNKFEFVEDANPQTELIKEDTDTKITNVMKRIKFMLEDGSDNDGIIDYLKDNIVEVDKIFIRELTTTLCEFAITKTNQTYKLDTERFSGVSKILHRYLDSKEERELECLYAIQWLNFSLEHPAGLVSQVFSELYFADVISPDSFIKWRDSKEHAKAGKGVTVKSLTSFFTEVKDGGGDTSDENN